MAVYLKGLPDRSHQGIPRVGAELESRSRGSIEGLHRVVQTAGGADNRHRTVFHTVDLVQPAGLIARGHQEHVRPGFDLVGQHIIVGDLYGHLVGVLPGQSQEELLVGPIARPERHQGEVFCEQTVGHLSDQVKSLLRGEAGYDSQHRSLPLNVLLPESHAFEQIPLALLFASQVLRRVVRGYESIRPRAPFLVVHSVQNAVDSLPTACQDSLQPEAELRGLDFPAVFLADRRNGVRVEDASFEQIHLAEIFQPVYGEHFRTERNAGKDFGRKNSLIPQIMNRKQNRGVVKKTVTGVEGAQIDGDESSLPVVTVNDVGGTRLPLHRLNRGEAEGCESFRIVGVVDAFHLV